MQKYLEATDIIDYNDVNIQKLARTLAGDTEDDITITKNCFEYVRDEIRHFSDSKDDITTCSASAVLSTKRGGVMPNHIY